MLIYWRVCEKQQTLSFVPRWENTSKLEIIKKCWLSLQQSVSPDDAIKIFEDECSQELLNWLQKTSKAPISIISIPKSDKSRNEYPIHYILPIDIIMNEDAHKHYNEPIYFCNDDFLHLPHAVHVMKSIYQDGWKSFAVTYDYPDRYTLDRTRQAEVFVNRMSHWRTIPSCTGVTMAPGSMWLKHQTVIKQNVQFNNDSWTWEVYAKEMCICPIPGVSTHLTTNCMTPLVNWKPYWDSIEI